MGTQKKKKGPYTHIREDYFLAGADDVSSLYIRLQGKRETLAERHNDLLSMAQYCQIRQVPVRWYPESLQNREERILYIRIRNDTDEHAWLRIRTEAYRRNLSTDKRSYWPHIAPVDPPVYTEETEERREEENT